MRTVKELKRVGYVVSDLHMFSKRSRWSDHLDDIYRAAEEADVFILNGDTFDFRWTTLRSVAETVDASVVWLRDLVNKYPQCHFHFVVGNHDNLQIFIEALSELAAVTSNLSWHPYYLKIGDSVFLHGDVSDRKMSADDLEQSRDEWRYDERLRHPALHHLYDWALHIGLHRGAQAVRYPKKLVARRVIAYLENVGLGALTGTRHVYFGHTHDAMSNYRYRGLVFHNAGSPMKGLEFNIIRVELKEDK
jgi:UDP-2,3-diacylglucosamine hydrolase